MGVSGIQFIGKFSSERTFIRFFITVMKRLRILLCKNYCNPRIKLGLKWIQTSRLKKLKCIQEENRKATPIFEIELLYFKVENILKGILDSIPSPSPSEKIQIMGGKVCLRCKGKTFLGILKTKSLLKSASNVLPHYFK